MTPPLHARSVKELQSIAQETRLSPPRAPQRPRLSRAAQLHLIDALSRWSATGLAVVAGVAIFIAVAVARDLEFRSLIWMALVFASLAYCRTRRKDFRHGARIASHPFRWRAEYTSALCVLSAAVGSGGLLLAPAAPSLAATEIIALLTIAILAGGMLHAAHARAAAAMILPGFAFLIAGAMRSTADGALVTTLFLGSAAIMGLTAAISGRYARQAALRFPRTRLLRREIFVEEDEAAPSQNSTDKTAIA